jgi:uncharacterized membrane protein
MQFKSEKTKSLLITLVVAFVASGIAQAYEYEVTIIPSVPEAFATTPTALNNNGTVIGVAQSTPSEAGFYLAGWQWTEAEGLIMLPPAPDPMSQRFQPNDINDDGVIVGDGGVDFGRVWRLDSEGYMLIGSLPTYNGSWGVSINSFGDVVGSAFNPLSFLTPRRALVFTDLAGLEDLFPDMSASGASAINDDGQIAATAGGGLRVEPDGTRTYIPIADGFVGMSASQINNNGDVAGAAICSHECDQPYLFTDEDGVQLITPMGIRHIVAGVNIHREVVGRVTEGGTPAWHWSQETGTRALQDLIDPTLGLGILAAWDINDNGQIIATGIDLSDLVDPRKIILLTPVTTEVMGDMDADGDVDLVDFANFQLCFTGPGVPVAEGACEFSDFDADGDCDLVDFNQFQLAFTGAQ